MSADPRPADDARRLRRALAAASALVVVIAAGLFFVLREEAPAGGPTVEEKIATLRAERASLQARAEGEARIALLPVFRTASLLADALAARSEPDSARAFDGLPAVRRQAFADLEALNGALKDALDRPGDGARLAAIKVAARGSAQLDRLAGDDAPLVLAYTPRFVPPRRAMTPRRMNNKHRAASTTKTAMPMTSTISTDAALRV